MPTKKKIPIDSGKIEFWLLILESTVILTLTLITIITGSLFWLLITLVAYGIFMYLIENQMVVFRSSLKLKIIVKNKDIDSRIHYTTQLLELAQREVKIVSGKLGNQVYNDDKIIGAFKNVLQSNVKVTIVVEKRIDEKSNRLLELLKQYPVELYILKDYKVSHHFIVVDEYHLRLESPHEGEAIERKAKYYFVTKRLGEKASRLFKEIESKGIRYDTLN